MGENFISNEEKKNIFENATAPTTDAYSLSELMKSMKPESQVKNEENSATVEKPVQVEEKLSPLEELKRQKELYGGGVVVSNEALEEGKMKAPETDLVHRPERMENFNKAVADLDETTRRRNAVVVLKQPQDQQEYINLMIEIDSVRFNEDGTAYFDYKDDEGNVITPTYCRIRKEGEDYFDFGNVKKFEDNKETSDETNSNEAKEETKTSEVDEEKAKTVQIIIDKTGLGSDFLFTDEEKAKIEGSDTIRINEVKILDINAIKAKRIDKSFQDTIKEYNLSGSRTTICFPASGFKAQMKGLSYGEFSDISLSMENVTFDQYHKRLSIIYNNMTNISSGPFETFEDFLKHFAYTDIPLAIYGMFISTEAENQEIQLRCGQETCKNSFNWKYSTRSVLRLERCANTFLEKMKEIASAPAIEFDKIHAASAVENSKMIELPDSKFVVEMGIASAYDFLYNFIPLMNEETFKEAFGEDINEAYMNNVLLLTSVRSVWVPNPDGTYTECTGYKDILDAIYHIGVSEIQILAAYTAKLQGEYEVTFSFGDVVCPHCGHVTHNLDISIDDLVFQTYQRLMSTNVDLENIQGF